MISAVLFDLDGTLVETEELKAISHARSVAELKPVVSRDEVISAYTDELVGRSRQEVAETLVQRYGLEEAARERIKKELRAEEPWQVLVSIRQGVYAEILGDTDLLLEQRYPHNIELLHELRARVIPRRVPPCPTTPRSSACSPCSASRTTSTWWRRWTTSNTASPTPR